MADMIEKIKNVETDVPKWDVALASLAHEEAEKLGRGLAVSDFQRLAREHAIRFDDIMATQFELVLQAKWRYEEVPGQSVVMTADEVEKLFEAGRLKEPDLKAFGGQWLPN